MKRLITLLAGLLAASGLMVQGQTFSVPLENGNKLLFNVTDSTAHTVEIIRAGSFAGISLALPSGSLDIPSSVTFKGKTYRVASISKEAFASAAELTSVSIPSSVKSVGEKAFAGCSKLEGVVFPASEPKFGNDVFEGCTALKSVSLGSDWKELDLNLFATCQNMTCLFVPARVRKITNLKFLQALERIDVDPNNQAFSSIDGNLYSKDGKVFYACPNSRVGLLEIPEGTEKIQEGAFNGCANLTEIILPSTLHAFSYLDFCQCVSLTKLTLLSEMPPMTAKWNGAPVFAIRCPGSLFKVYVPAGSLSRYQASVCAKAGGYETPASGKKETCSEDGFLTDKGILKNKASR